MITYDELAAGLEDAWLMAGLHDHLVAGGRQLAHARRHEADAVLVDLDFLRTADLHLDPLQPRSWRCVLPAAAGRTRDYPLRIPAMATAQDSPRLVTHPAALAQAFDLQRRAFAADPRTNR